MTPGNPQNPMQPMFRLDNPDASLNNPYRTRIPPTPRPPGNVPYVVDNLWEWARPEGFPSRRQCVCASPTPALAQQYGGTAAGRVYEVRQLVGARVAQLELPDAKLHADARSLHKTLLQLLGGSSFLTGTWAARQALAPLWMPCLTRDEVEALFATEPALAAIKTRLMDQIGFWKDVRLVSLSSPWPFPQGEIFFEAQSWHLVLVASGVGS